MTKKEYCLKNKPIAYYYDGLNSLEIHGIKYDIDNYIYCTSERVHQSGGINE